MKSRDKKRKKQEENDVLLEIGKEGSEGIKNFVEVKKQEEKREAEVEAEVLEEIESKRKKKLDYNHFLCEILLQEINSIEIPSGWKIRVGPTDKGVILELQNPDIGKIYRSAFGSTGDPKLDLNAVHTYALRTEETIYRMKKDGIVNGIARI